MTRLLCCSLALATLLAPLAGVQARIDPAAQWKIKKQLLHLNQSLRHLEYGLDLRKEAMTTQSAAEIILAVELGVEAGRGTNLAAEQVFAIMRQYDAAFWKRYGSRPTPAKVAAYDKKARALLLSDEKDALELANWGTKNKLEHEAQEIYLELLHQQDEPLEFDAKGQIKLPAGAIPKDASEKLRDGAITINGKLYIRDELLAKMPSLKEIFEVSSTELRVRTTTTFEDARELHAMCMQLLPALALDLGTTAERRLPLYVFAKREEYEKTLDALDLGAHKIVLGVASPWPFAAVVCAEGIEPDILHGVCLHETTHLFCYAVSHTVFPAWYSEGYADTFGGTETFKWANGKLSLRGLFPRSRIDALKADGGTMALSELLAADQFAEWKKSKEAGLAFYAQSWAFLRYLRTGAGPEIAARFDQWETRCIGQALGFELGRRRLDTIGPASDLFVELFGKDLAKLEAGFKLWLRDL